MFWFIFVLLFCVCGCFIVLLLCTLLWSVSAMLCWFVLLVLPCCFNSVDFISFLIVYVVMLFVLICCLLRI